VRNQANVKEIITKALSRVPLFQDLPESALNELAGLAGIARREKNSVIFDEEESRERVYIIASGEVKLYWTAGGDSETGPGDSGPGEKLGEMSLFDNLPGAGRAVAVEDCVLFYLDRKDFLEFLRSHPETAFILLQHTSLKWRHAGGGPSETGEHSDAKEAARGQAERDRRGFTPESVAGPGPEDGNQSEKDRGGEKGESEEDWLFNRKYTCPLCRKETSSLMPRSKYVQVSRTDTDLCTYYRLVNPTFYYVVVCTHCGFAFPQDARDPLRPAVFRELEKDMPFTGAPEQFSGLRNIDRAIETYRLVVKCQALVKAKNSLLGRLYLRLGCLYRQKGVPEEEQECLQKARDYLEQAYTGEYITDPRGEMNLIYLVGELYGRLGNVAEAIQWFSKVTTHPYRNSYRYIVNRARDRWQELKKRV